MSPLPRCLLAPPNGADRLSRGLFLAWVMRRVDTTLPALCVDKSDAGSLLGILDYCREHGITGAA